MSVEVPDMSHAKMPPSVSEKARDHGVDVRRYDNRRSTWREIRCNMAQQLNGVGNMFDHINQRNDVEWPANVSMGKGTKMDRQTVLLGGLLQPHRWFNALRRITHSDCLLNQKACAGTDVKQTSTWLKCPRKFQNLFRLNASSGASVLIRGIDQLLIVWQHLSHVRTLAKAAAAALVNSACYAIMTIGYRERLASYAAVDIRRLDQGKFSPAAQPAEMLLHCRR